MSETSLPAIPKSWLELPDGRMFWLGARCAVGRHPENDLTLDLPALSRYHALLTADGDRYVLSDLHSRNGTYLNRSTVSRPVPLQDRDEIRFGDVAVRFRCQRSAPQDPSAVAPTIALTQQLHQVQERPCWLMMVDIAGFAALNEKIGSENALRHMQAWITELRPLIEGNGGTINGYLGDALFVYWLGDRAQPAHVLASLRAIETWRPKSPLNFRVVVHHGAVLFTHSDRGEELTGQQVNFLFRSEKVAKVFSASAMLSEAAVQSLGLTGLCTACGQSKLDGMNDLFTFYLLPADFTTGPKR